MKHILVFLLLAFGYQSIQAQSKSTSFRLEGVINADTGTVVLLPTGEGVFDPNKGNTYTAKIHKGTFTFSGKMAFPCSFMLQLRPMYVSNYFMVDPGVQTIRCNVDSLRETPILTNKSMLTESPVLNSTKRFLLAYAKQNPGSYTAFWELVRRLQWGYEPVYDSIYAALSQTVKQTYSGNVLAQRLKSAKLTSVGYVFPTLPLVDINNRAIDVPAQKKAKYTLVDFWFSHCSACIEEFPKLKKLYTSYKPVGFEIIGISIDKKAELNDWKKAIVSKELDWKQYLDMGGKFTEDILHIQYFPSNFLLDERGVIVKRDIRPEDLDVFLAKRLRAEK